MALGCISWGSRGWYPGAWLLAGFFAAWMTACGGGGSTHPPTPLSSATPSPTATPTPTSTPTPTPTVAPGASLDPNWRTQVNCIGRFDQSDAGGPRFSWSASTLQAAFQGTNLAVSLARTELWDSENFFNVRVDGGTSTTLKVDHDGVFSLASGLAEGPHVVELSRRDEGMYADIQYQGFLLDQGHLLAPPARSERRVEFIGDSITCGYGNEAANESMGFTTATENAYLAYGPVTARKLSAEACVIAWSGIGIYRNGSGTDNQMPEIYPRTLSKSPTPVWDFSTWVPQVVVVNLCTNDFGPGIPDRTAFVKAYQDFIATLRAHYPSAHVFCAVGPMMGGAGLTAAVDYIQNGVMKPLVQAGDGRLHFIQFPTQDPADGLGADWHPSLRTHQKMADQLTEEIRTLLGW